MTRKSLIGRVLDLAFSPWLSLVVSAIALPAAILAAAAAWYTESDRTTALMLTAALMAAMLVGSAEAVRRKRMHKRSINTLDGQIELVQRYRHRQQAVIQRMRDGDPDAFAEFDHEFGDEGREALYQSLDMGRR